MRQPPFFSYIFQRLVVFNLLFLSLQFLFMFGEGVRFISAFPMPAVVLLELGYNLLIHIALYLLLSVIQSLIVSSIMRRSWHYFSLDNWIIIVCILSITALLTANIYYFPLSQFSQLFSPPLPRMTALIPLVISIILLTGLIVNSLFSKNRWIMLLPLAILILPNLIFFIPDSSTQSSRTAQAGQPDIIIIGFDSLSMNTINKRNMPNLSRLLESSTVFKNAVIPLARTYPAWVSILTGLYPKQHGARFNLVPKDMVKNSASIAWSLKARGYQTVYATDERRFNNMDKEFGFETIIGPKLGMNDILLGLFNDFPLSNLLINLPVAQWLFPYNYINRGSYFSYYPQTFNRHLKRQLNTVAPDKPLFLSLHFVLPHWPYTWASSSPPGIYEEYSIEELQQMYASAVHRVDKQAADIIDFLEKKGYMNNSLLVLLSDHGEALYIQGSRPLTMENYQGSKQSSFKDYLERKTATALEKSAGHGSDLMSPEQYHSLLAFKLYSKDGLMNDPGEIMTRVSLIDVAPTIADFLNFKMMYSPDGISLLKTVKNNQSKLPQRPFYLESGMLPNQILSKTIAKRLGVRFYRADKSTGELVLKKKRLHELMDEKLYGVISGDWILAFYPDDGKDIQVLLQLSKGYWTDEQSSHFYQRSKAQQLVNQMAGVLPD